MKKCVAAVVVAFLFNGGARAGENAKPLGLELGVATYEQVTKVLGAQTSLENVGTHLASGGPVLRAKGEGLGVDDLSDVTLVFDRKNVLVAAELDFPKTARIGGSGGSFAKMANQLQSEYRPVARSEPFVGDASAHYKAGDSTVLAAPHMSFTMSLTYTTRQFQAAVARQAREGEAEARKKQASEL